MDDKNFEAFGKFELANDRKVFGQLTVAGEATRLSLQDDGPLGKLDFPNTFMHGILHDFKKVTLLDCTQMENTTIRSHESVSHRSVIAPLKILIGNRHLNPEDLIVKSISFAIGDAWILFHDYKAFGFDKSAKQNIVGIVKEESGANAIVGDDPRIVYFTGKKSIVDVDTCIGKVYVQHCPGWDIGGAHGIRIDNKIFISISFPNLLTADAAIQRLIQLLRFLELMIGRAQESSNVYLQLTPEESLPIELLWTFAPSKPELGGRVPHAFDVLIDPINEPENFATVMRNWLSSDGERGHARARFLTSFRNHNVYDIDRLIRAANMFDLLPTSAIQADVELSPELVEAKKVCRELFLKLPKTLERESMLNSLGRIGKLSLKHKVLSRARFLIDGMSDTFPELEKVLATAVDCRNHYVHGNQLKIDNEKIPGLTTFLTDALEFVFAVSDLNDMGWNAYAYIFKLTTMSHALGAFRVDYAERLRALNLYGKNWGQTPINTLKVLS